MVQGIVLHFKVEGWRAASAKQIAPKKRHRECVPLGRRNMPSSRNVNQLPDDFKKLPDDFERLPDKVLQSKEYFELMKRRDATLKLTILTISGMLSGLAICGMGIWLVSVSGQDASTSNINFLGLLEVQTGSVGIGAFAIGAGLTIYCVRSFMSKW